MKHIGKLSRTHQAKLTKGTEPAGKTGAPQDYKAKGGAAREAYDEKVLTAQQAILKRAIRWARLIVAVNGFAAGFALAGVVLGAAMWWLIPAAFVALVALGFHEAEKLLLSGRFDHAVLSAAKELVESAQK
jgi:fatty acid desaturase